MLFKFYFIIGMFVNFYYLNKNGDKYEKDIQEGRLKLASLLLGVFLTAILWPIAIYNNEFKGERILKGCWIATGGIVETLQACNSFYLQYLGVVDRSTKQIIALHTSD